MRFIRAVRVILLLMCQAGAAPIVESAAFTPKAPKILAKRANPTAVVCGPPGKQQVWSRDVVQNAFDALQFNDGVEKKDKPKAENILYPHQLGKRLGPRDPSVKAALDLIPECATSLFEEWKWFEFPITHPVFVTGPAESQGTDRVIAISRKIIPGGTRLFTYCLAVTHSGATPKGAFDPCISI